MRRRHFIDNVMAELNATLAERSFNLMSLRGVHARRFGQEMRLRKLQATWRMNLPRPLDVRADAGMQLRMDDRPRREPVDLYGNRCGQGALQVNAWL